MSRHDRRLPSCAKPMRETETRFLICWFYGRMRFRWSSVKKRHTSHRQSAPSAIERKRSMFSPRRFPNEISSSAARCTEKNSNNNLVEYKNKSKPLASTKQTVTTRLSSCSLRFASRVPPFCEFARFYWKNFLNEEWWMERIRSRREKRKRFCWPLCCGGRWLCYRCYAALFNCVCSASIFQPREIASECEVLVLITRSSEQWSVMFSA